jgi:ComF family protein
VYRALLSIVAPPLCWSCQRDARPGEALCLGCRAALRWLGPEPVRLSGVEVWAPVAYEGPARELVRALKFRGASGVAEAMSAAVAAGVPPALLEGRELVPVPLHRAQQRRRGFNQAARLAEALGERAGLAVADCLERRGPVLTQVGRGAAERRAGPLGEVRAVGAAPARALLVDDVVTTGATLAACAAALRAAGSREIAAVAYCRTVGR